MAYKLFGFLSFVCLYGFFHGLYVRKMQTKIDHLQEQLSHMETKVTLLQTKTARARLLVESKEDPATLELILMQNLGLVPKGSRKVYFKQ